MEFLLNKKKLKKQALEKGLDYNENKPWGCYYNIKEENFREIERKGKKHNAPSLKEKVIFVNSGFELSVQTHKQRDETWKALTNGVTLMLGSTLNNMKEITLKKGEKVFVPKNYFHQLFNKNNNEIAVWERQTGICFEEDIERFNDPYGRT